MTNLLEETLKVLSLHGKSFDDIEFISGNGHEISKDDFRRISSCFSYDDSYGHVHVPEDLVIAGDSWWLERGEYDGSEWWEYKSKPTRPFKCRRLQSIDGEEYDNDKYVYDESEVK